MTLYPVVRATQANGLSSEGLSLGARISCFSRPVEKLGSWPGATALSPQLAVSFADQLLALVDHC